MAASPGPATDRIGGTSSNSPSAVVTSPGTMTRTDGQRDQRAVAHRAARFGQAGPQLADLVDEVRTGHRRQKPHPSRKVASSTSSVQPHPTVDTSAKTTASSTTA